MTVLYSVNGHSFWWHYLGVDVGTTTPTMTLDITTPPWWKRVWRMIK